MELIGDIERAVATLIYPNRILIAAVALVAIALLAIVARRRRWGEAVRRHPRGATVAAVITVAIGGPVAWYLGSPLVLSRTVDEPAPIVAAAVSPATTAPSPAALDATPSARPSSPASSSATQPPTLTPAPPLMLEGTFAGADDFHFGRGTAKLIETAPGMFVVRLEDFEVRNGPDLFVHLSPSATGYADGAVSLGRLKADRGNQNYPVPDGTKVADARSVVIWCRQFAVLFATAPLA